MKEKLEDVLVRAGKTFWQAALASLVVALPEIIDLIPMGWEAIMPVLLSAGVGALAAGLSAVYNGFIAPTFNKVKAKSKTAVIVEAEQNGGEASVDEGK